MPSKSKRNRRASSQRAFAQRAITPDKIEATATTGSGAAAPAASIPVQPQRAAGSYRPASRGAATEPMVYTNFSRDIKWIGLVTAIVVVLLIASYYIFK
jgi:hypothetical protein